MFLYGGDYYDLGVQKVFTILNNPITIRSNNFFTAAIAQLNAGTDLNTQFIKTYAKFEDLWDIYKADVIRYAPSSRGQ
jgi:hypothetical protein